MMFIRSTQKKLIFLIAIFIAINCYSIDRSVYVGTWKSGNNENIFIVINNNFNIDVYVRNKKLPKIEFIIDHAKKGNVTSAMPFLYIESHNGGDIENTFFLIIGFQGIWNAKHDNDYNVLSGFYEVSKIINSDGELDERSIPIEFKKIKK
jgi:hypothetical protein